MSAGEAVHKAMRAYGNVAGKGLLAEVVEEIREQAGAPKVQFDELKSTQTMSPHSEDLDDGVLQFAARPKAPLVSEGPFCRRRAEKFRFIFFCEVKIDRHRFKESRLAIDHGGNFSIGIDF